MGTERLEPRKVERVGSSSEKTEFTTLRDATVKLQEAKTSELLKTAVIASRDAWLSLTKAATSPDSSLALETREHIIVNVGRVMNLTRTFWDSPEEARTNLTTELIYLNGILQGHE